MTADWDDLVMRFIDENGKDMSAVLVALFDVRTSDDITSEIVDRFLMECLEEGLEVLKTRAIQTIEENYGQGRDELIKRCDE